MKPHESKTLDNLRLYTPNPGRGAPYDAPWGHRSVFGPELMTPHPLNSHGVGYLGGLGLSLNPKP